MALIEKDVKTIEELKTVIGHGGKAAVLYNVNTGEPYGLDVEVLIAMDASIGNKVEKVTGKSLIADTEIARLSGVTNQTLGGLGGEAAANKQDSLAVDGHGIKFPTVDAVNLGLATKPAKTVQVVAGAGLTGGGTLEADRTLNVVSANDGITVNADNIQLNVVDGLESTSATQPLSAKQGKILNDGKVDKVVGKGLSTEDYTTGEKAKVANVPLNTNTELAAKVDKVVGKSLILDTEIARLAGVTNQTKQTLGIENVDNTSDLDKPVSTATQTALNGKVNTTDIEQVRSQATNKVASSKLLDDELNTIEGLIDVLENRADAAESDITVNTADIRLLENVINSANINQETTATVTGVDTVTLPKTAANTGMQVQLLGQSAENLVVNGDFRNGTTGWTVIAGGLSVVSGNLLNTGTGSSNNPRNFATFTGVNGNKVYGVVRFRVTNSDSTVLSVGVTSASTTFGAIYNPVQNQWYILSNVITWGTDTSIRIQHTYATNEAALNKVMEVDYAYAINLTATFGAGNEPTKEQCDLLFANYFEGMDNVLGTGRVRSVGKNLFNPYTAVVYQRGGTYTVSYTDEKTKIILRSVFLGGIIGYYIPVIQNTTYNIKPFDYQYTSASKNISLYLASYSQIPTIGDITLNRINEVSFNITTGGQITTGAGSKYLLVAMRVNADSVVGDYIGGIYVGTASIPTTYEPYKETNLYLTTPELRSNGLTKDEIRKGTNGYELIQRINPADGTVRATPVITPISRAGLLNSNSNGTAYFEPIIADAGVYSTNLAIQLTDYPIASFESIRKYANGTYTELNPATAVIASGGLSFTHPDLANGDLVMFTYAYNRESIGRSMTLTHYDSRFVVKDTANANVYRITPTITNGVLTWTLTLV